MSYLIGHGRYARETYPQSPSAGGGGGSLVPLSRQRFIDGGTTNPGPGAASAPFPTIADFIASRTDVSVPDADANYVGWLTPAIGGYSESIVFPPNISIELRAPSLFSAGTYITGTVTWNNVTVAHPAAQPFIALHNVLLKNILTVLDDGSGPLSTVVFGGDENSGGSAGIEVSSGSAFDASGASTFQGAVFYNITIAGNIDAGTGVVDAQNIICRGDVLSCSALLCSGCSLTCDSITASTEASFENTTFTTATTLTVPLALFDGVSWMSFVGAGGTRTAGTVVLAVGGYNGAAVEGTSTITAASTSLALDGTGDIADGGNHYTTAAGNTTPTSVTLETSSALPGDTMLITKVDNGVNALAVNNGGGGGGLIGTIPSNTKGFVLAQFNGTDWVFAEGGSLAT